MKKQRKIVRPEKRSVLRNYDAKNLEIARLVLAERAKHEGPTTGCQIQWAERVIQRLGAEKEKEAA